MDGIQTADTAPEIVLGSEAYNTPRGPLLHTDGLVPSSPTLRIQKTRFQQTEPMTIASSPPQQPAKRTRRTDGPSGTYSVPSYGIPQTAQDAIIQAKNFICLAIGKAPESEQSSLIKLAGIFEDYINGRPLTSSAEALNMAAQKMEKATRNLQQHKTSNPTPSTSTPGSGPTEPNSSRGLSDSVWNSPNNQLRQDMGLPPVLNTPQKTPKAAKKPQHDTKHKRRERRLVLIKSQDQDYSRYNPTNIRNAINKAAGKTIVQLVSLSKSGNMVLTTTEDFSAEDLLKEQVHYKQLVPHIEAKIDREQFQVVAHGIPIRGMDLYEIDSLNSPQGLAMIEDEIKIFNKGLELELVDHVHWLTSIEKRSNPDTFKVSVTIPLKTAEQAKRVVRRGLCVFGLRIRVEPLHSGPPNLQCAKCQGFGHYADSCKTDARCRICAQTHETRLHTCNQCALKGRACIHTQIQCANCKESHQANDKNCPHRPSIPPRHL